MRKEVKLAILRGVIADLKTIRYDVYDLVRKNLNETNIIDRLNDVEDAVKLILEAEENEC